MAGPRSTPIPTGEPARFERSRRRTRVLRLALALGLVAALAAAVVEARGEDVRQAPLVPEGKTGIMVLDLSASTSGAAFQQTIEQLAEGDERVGLVAFSDAAYELLPPGTPGRELRSLLRFFGGGRVSASTPWDDFRAGTRVSEGLRMAREILDRDGVANGSVLLVSDFEILADEVERVADEVGLLRGEGVEIRLVPLAPTPERRARMDAILGGSAVLREEEADAPVRAPEARSLQAAAPWAFLAVAGLLVTLLAANEALLARLEVRR